MGAANTLLSGNKIKTSIAINTNVHLPGNREVIKHLNLK